MNNSTLIAWVATGNINGVGAANEFQATEGVSSNANSHDAFQMTVTAVASTPPPPTTPPPSSLVLALTGLLLAGLYLFFGRNFRAANFS